MGGFKYSSEEERAAAKRASRKRWDDKNPGKSQAARVAWEGNNRERVNANRRARNAIRKDEISTANAIRYAADPAKFQASSRSWRLKNPKRVLASVKAWRRLNKKCVRTYEANNRARRRRAKGTHTAQDIENIGQMQMWKCALCGASIKHRYQRDHIMPLALNGSNNRRNIQLTCPPCNVLKGAKDLLVYARERGFLL